jgi:hypothetical protein
VEDRSLDRIAACTQLSLSDEYESVVILAEDREKAEARIESSDDAADFELSWCLGK